MQDVWIVGGGPEERALRELIREKGLEDYVTLLGMQSNPYPYIRQADLYVQPSRFEGHCVTVMEARILAKPILATTTAAEEQLVDGLTGKLCPPDSASIAAASILAKVCRDHIMRAYDHRYPQYGFARHKGYPTKEHLAALDAYGVLDIHRRSYAPVRKALTPQLSLVFGEEEK